MLNPKERLIVALDGDWNLDQLVEMARVFGRDAGMLKLGKRLFTRHGSEAVRRLTEAGAQVFLDLKYHDIPNTVGQACAEAAALDCAMLTLHASGGRQMMVAARKAADEAAAKRGKKPPKLVGVTVLTSLDEAQLHEVGVEGALEEQVGRLAILAKECGLDGVVASPKEIGLIRERCGQDFLIVTPGIRPEGTAGSDDQKRTLTPREAVQAGASYLVIGRPVYGAPDPLAALHAIAESIN